MRDTEGMIEGITVQLEQTMDENTLFLLTSFETAASYVVFEVYLLFTNLQ